MIDSFGLFMLSVLGVIFIFCVYQLSNPGKKEKESAKDNNHEPKIDDHLPNDDFWIERIKTTQEEMIELFMPDEESLVLLRRALSENKDLLILARKEDINLKTREDARSQCVDLTFSLGRDFMGVYRITVNTFIEFWRGQVIRNAVRSVPKSDRVDFDKMESKYGYLINDVGRLNIEKHWTDWLSKTLSGDLGYVILNSSWDIFSPAARGENEVTFCSPESIINQFNVSGSPSDVYHQLINYTGEMKRYLEKEYIESVGFFSQKISHYISETVLSNISVLELKGQSIIKLDANQSFVRRAVLSLDKNDFILDLKLFKPEVELDEKKLEEYVTANLLSFFSDYGKEVEIINETTSNTDLIPYDSYDYERDRRRVLNQSVEFCYSFIMRIKEKDENVHFGDSGETLDGSAEDQGS